MAQNCNSLRIERILDIEVATAKQWNSHCFKILRRDNNASRLCDRFFQRIYLFANAVRQWNRWSKTTS